MRFRLTPSRLEIGYIALSVLAIAVFAFPLWYAWKVNIETLKIYVEGNQVDDLVRVFETRGERGLADAMESRSGNLPGDEIMLLADASGRRLAGNLSAWPPEIPAAPGTYGVVIGLGDGTSIRVVATHVGLPGGYRLLLGRESARFQSLVQVFWVGVVAATAVVLLLGIAVGWSIRRAILSEVDEIGRTAAAIAEGDYSRRVPDRRGSGEIRALRQSVNGMLDQLATQNSRLEKEVAERDGAERALQQAHAELESLVSQRTAELARVNESLEHALRETEQQKTRLDELFDLAPDAVVLTTIRNPRNVRVNKEFTRMFGYTAEEAVGRRMRDLIAPPELKPADLTVNPDLLAGRTVEKEVMRQRKDGSRFHAHITAKRICLLDAEDAAYVIYRDISERKRAELALRESEARFRSLTELSSDFFWETDAADRYTSIEFGRRYRGVGSGVSKLGRTRWEIPSVSPDEAAWSAHRAAIAARQSFFGFCVSRIEGSEERFYEFSGEPRFDADGQFLGYRGIGHDLTERKQAERALRVSEERYARAMEATEAGHWEWDLRTNVVFHSQRFRELHGASTEENFSSRDEWKARQRYLPGERERQDRAIRGAIDGPINRYEIDVQVEPRPGEVRWLRSRGKLFRDEAGRPVLMAGTSIDITEQKLAQEALRHSEERYGRAMEASDDGLWEWNLATDHIFASPRARHLFGVPDGEEILSRADLVARGRFHPDDRPRIEDTLRQCLDRGYGGFEIEYRVAGPGGNVNWIRSRGKIFPDEKGRPALLTGSLTDITERRKAEEEVRRQRAYLDQLFELAPVAIILNSAESRTLRVNREFTRMFGYAADEVVGRSIRDLIVPRGAGAITEDPRFRAGERIEDAVVRKRKDGSLFHAHAIAARIPLPDAENAAYVIYHDITERKRAEEALRAGERRRRQAQHLESMGTLAGGIAHDFNNILGAILGYGEMALRDAQPGSRLRRDLDSILTAGERGRALVDRVLTFSRSGMGERIPVYVEKVVREALGMLEPGVPEGILVEAQLEAGRAAMLGEPTQVHQLLTNLATNAIQAMPGGGTLRVSLRTRRFDAERGATIGTVVPGDYILLEVVDSGTGIAPEIFDRIFDPFVTTKDVNVGNGLGLSLVHGIVTEVGGAIDVVSTVGAGSTFTVYLPRTGDAPDANAEDGGHLLPRGNGQRVLVVDDEEPLLRLTVERLEELGYRAAGFTSSIEAIEAYRADPDGFDAVITDERMPRMSGSTLIHEIRRVRQAIPILLVSGFVGGMVTRRAYNEGADEVLKKPLSMRDLAAGLARVFRQ